MEEINFGDSIICFAHKKFEFCEITEVRYVASHATAFGQIDMFEQGHLRKIKEGPRNLARVGKIQMFELGAVRNEIRKRPSNPRTR